MYIKCSHTMLPQQYKILPGWKALIKNHEIKYTIVNFGTDYDRYQYITIIKDMFIALERHIAPIQFNSSKDDNEGYIRIHFADAGGNVVSRVEKKDGTIEKKFVRRIPVPFGEGVLAYQLKGDMYINGRVFFQIKDMEGGFSLLRVMKHEGFHGLAIGHTTAKFDLMQPFYGKQNNNTYDTQRGLDAIYEKERIAAFNASHHWNMFREKGIVPSQSLAEENNNFKPIKNNNMGILDKILASFIDSFKSKNPTIFALILFALGAVIAVSEVNGFSDIFGASEIVDEVIKWAAIAYGFLKGSRTVKFLPEDGVQALKDKDPNYLD